MKAIDYTGMKIGMLTVIKRADEKLPGVGNVCWECKCDCGNTVVRSSQLLGLKKGVRSCGCYDFHSKQRKDITGQRFGKLVAIRPTGIMAPGRSQVWVFQCDCGNVVERPHVEITNKGKNPTRSCGCSKAWFIGNSEHGKKHFENIKRECVFGTNLQQIRKSDLELDKNNTSGYKGVSYISTRDVWVAEMGFQGSYVSKTCHSLDEAIEARKAVRVIRDEFVDWYDSMNEEEKKQAALEYENNQKMFKNFYKRKMAELTGGDKGGGVFVRRRQEKQG